MHMQIFMLETWRYLRHLCPEGMIVQATRRELLGQSGVGLVLAPLARSLTWMTPMAAAACGAGWQSLRSSEAQWLDGLAEAIAPPTKDAGFSHFIDHHLTIEPAKSLLALRYLDVAPPYLDFYRGGIAALAKLAGAGADVPPAGDATWATILTQLGKGGGSAWHGPPAQLFLFALRLDAIDVAYGTRAAFARLGIEYLPHLEPDSDW